MKTYAQLTDAIMKGKGGAEADGKKGGGKKPSKPAPPPVLCRFFFHSGYCRAGDACRFSHDADGMSREEALKTIPCPYFATGECRYGEYCELKHDDAARKSREAVCGICLETVLSKHRNNFGLLSCCNHIFCMSCLMEWRTEGSQECTTRRVCPTCRKASDYVVPSSVLPQNDEEKEQILENYKASLSEIPCKHFEIGELGSCPFGRDCFYAHRDRKGRDIKRRDRGMQQLYEERRQHRHERDIDYITEMDFDDGTAAIFHERQGQKGQARPRGRGW